MKRLGQSVEYSLPGTKVTGVVHRITVKGIRFQGRAMTGYYTSVKGKRIDCWKPTSGKRWRCKI